MHLDLKKSIKFFLIIIKAVSRTIFLYCENCRHQRINHRIKITILCMLKYFSSYTDWRKKKCCFVFKEFKFFFLWHLRVLGIILHIQKLHDFHPTSKILFKFMHKTGIKLRFLSCFSTSYTIFHIKSLPCWRFSSELMPYCGIHNYWKRRLLKLNVGWMNIIEAR